MAHPLNLNNQESALFKTAMSFMKDPEISKQYGYDNQDKILGFRLAVNDARRELMEAAERGELDLTSHKAKPKKKLVIETKKRRKAELATPESESSDSDTPPVSRTPQDAAAAEIARRNKLKEVRMRV
jgi:glycyl-tRNA synthetase (class II)